ncbi:hypothetical protein [Arthrobacter sp. TMN-50]
MDEPQADGRLHPCHKVVHAQDDHPGPFQVPEAWAGNLETAKVVFVSSNPAISEGRPEAKLPSKRIAEKYPTVEWPEEDTADFMIRRFTSEREWVLDRRHLKVDGSRGRQETYWGWIMRQTQALLGQDSIWHEDAVMTEVVHCKSNKEEGVSEAAIHCSSLHMGRILSATSAGLVVVVGVKARQAFMAAYPSVFIDRPRFGTDEPDGRPDPAQNIFVMDIGGKQRLVCFLWHGQAGSQAGKITHLPHLYPEDFGRLQAAAAGTPASDDPLPPASKVRRQWVVERILDPSVEGDEASLRSELLTVFSLDQAKEWLQAYNSEIKGCPADLFLLHGLEPVILAFAAHRSAPGNSPAR